LSKRIEQQCDEPRANKAPTTQREPTHYADPRCPNPEPFALRAYRPKFTRSPKPAGAKRFAKISAWSGSAGELIRSRFAYPQFPDRQTCIPHTAAIACDRSRQRRKPRHGRTHRQRQHGGGARTMRWLRADDPYHMSADGWTGNLGNRTNAAVFEALLFHANRKNRHCITRASPRLGNSATG